MVEGPMDLNGWKGWGFRDDKGLGGTATFSVLVVKRAAGFGCHLASARSGSLGWILAEGLDCEVGWEKLRESLPNLAVPPLARLDLEGPLSTGARSEGFGVEAERIQIEEASGPARQGRPRPSI